MSFHSLTTVFNVIIKMMILRKQLLNKLQRNTRRHQETDKYDMTQCEKATNQDTRKFNAGLQMYFMQEGNEGSPIYATETCDEFVQLQLIKRIRQGTLNQFLCH
jgi:hypothetical protein